jgi:ABC-type sugar transport system ATPase subunit
VAELGVADRQLIAIARAMAHDPRLLILDEPTSSLSASEAERLFLLIERLSAKGVAVLYISHRMSDIRRIADRIVSMRDGEISGVFEGEELDYEGAVNAMLGHRMTDVDIKSARLAKRFSRSPISGLLSGSKPFDLTCRENEVVAITGLLGSGKTAFAQMPVRTQKPPGWRHPDRRRGLCAGKSQGRDRPRRLHVAKGPRQQRRDRRFRHHPQHHPAVHWRATLTCPLSSGARTSAAPPTR